ncbi:hypothetical protein [Yoonia sp.]|uniref:hypothetical protein n=1 Tax=Yoonia sp. TaxID=2212373 RepID=UPI00358E2F26
MILRALISALVLFALTLSSFGHRTLLPAEEAQAESFILAGGNWAELCGEGGDPLSTVGKCMACVIAQTCATPTPAVMARSLSSGEAIIWPREASQTRAVSRISAHPARAPPFA